MTDHKLNEYVGESDREEHPFVKVTTYVAGRLNGTVPENFEECEVSVTLREEVGFLIKQTDDILILARTRDLQQRDDAEYRYLDAIGIPTQTVKDIFTFSSSGDRT